ncbi:PH domain-containing protein [Sphingobacterium faecium]|uniref:PH domain-containing protein n=1 Tax=Sphingobacterium faecium TaxID=34087 RepID=UPI00320A7882
MKIYRPKIYGGTYIWLLIILAIFIFNSYGNINKGLYLGALLSTAFLGFIWYVVFIFPRYSIIDKSLNLNNFLEKKTISIPSIRKIERNQTRGLYPFFNPYQKGLVVHFNIYDDVFINPNSEDTFLQEILKVNPTIEIIS